MKYLVLFLALASLSIAAEDGGLTGEPDPAPTVTKPQQDAIAMRELVRTHGKTCAQAAEQAVNTIQGLTPSEARGHAVAFWARVGTKGKRTLKWITDQIATADAAAPAGTDYVSPTVRAAVAKWTANPDNTVTVAQ